MLLRTLTRRVIDLAQQNDGLITRHDILRLGGTTNHVTALIAVGVIVRLHPGVFALSGIRDDHHLRVRAGLLAVGPDGVASHESAAWLQGLVDHPPKRVHLTVAPSPRKIKGVVVHKPAQAPPKGPRFRGIACTPPGRTLLDLAATATPRELDDAVDRALAKGLIRIKDLLALTKGDNEGRRGVAALRRCLDERGLTNVPSPSVLESKMARLLVRYGLPPATPEHIAGPLGEYRIDYAYAAARVAIELYGYASHRTPEQLRADQARQRKLTIQGWTVIVFTWRDVVNTPAIVARDIRAALQNCSKAPTKAENRNT